MKIAALARISLSLPLLACATSQQDQAPSSSSHSNAPPAGSSISEEEFKALHALRTDAAPPSTGTMVEIEGSRAYLSLPAKAKSPSVGIVMIHEWWGLNDHIKHWADRLASEGYAVVAVDLYGGVVATTPDDAMRAMKAVDQEKAVKTMRAGHRFLAADARVKAQRTGSIGWCFGGRMSLMLAISEPELDAAVMYYGSPETDPARLKTIGAKLLGVFANQDEGIPPEQVDSFEKALGDAGVDARILRYDAAHGFANPSGKRYDEAAAKAAWEQVVTFLDDLKR